MPRPPLALAAGPWRGVGRRRRRLYWTLALLLLAGLLGGAFAAWKYRAGRPETYRTGEAHAGITRQLDRGLPSFAPEPRFVDVTREAGLAEFQSFTGARTSQLPEDMGPGAAWGDFDGDGDDDLFLVSAGGPLGTPEDRLAPSRLYRNRGDGTFEEVADFPPVRIHGMSAAWGDHDGDGRLDLVLSGFNTLRLYRNTGDGFVLDPTLPTRDGFWAGVSWADFDRDGDLDLYVCGYVRYRVPEGRTLRSTQQYGRAVPYTLNPASFEPEVNLLLRNDGAAGFREVAAEYGVDNPQGRSLGALWHDLDDDGWPDLYVANDISDNALYANRGGRFEDVSYSAWVADYRGAMGLAAGDWNRDGDDDLFVSHWVAQENALYDSLLGDLPESGNGTVGEGSRGNSPALRFMDVASPVGLGQPALQSVGWGSEFADVDADGWLDLVVVNGSTFEGDEVPRRLVPQRSFLFWNRGGESYHDLGGAVPALAQPQVSRGLALSDYDGDGDVDLLIVDLDAGVRLLRNEMQQGNWLQVTLGGIGTPAASKHAVVEGTRVTVHAGDAAWRRTASGVSYLSQSSRTLHFGLGEVAAIDRVVVDWASGERVEHTGLDVNARWGLTPGAPPQRATASTLPSSMDVSSKTAPTREATAEFWRLQRAAMNAMKVDGDPQRAIGLFRQALALDPAHEDSLYYLGNCLAEVGDVQGALRRFAELMRRNTQSHRAHKRWGVLQATTAQTDAEVEAAVQALQRAREINPEETGVLLVLGELSLLRGDPEAAQQQLEWVVRSNPQTPEGWFVLGYLAWKNGDAEGAVDLLQRARGARGDERIPEGAVAEGDTRRKMHREETPLVHVVERWDGEAVPARAFRELDAHLTRSRLRPAGRSSSP